MDVANAAMAFCELTRRSDAWGGWPSHGKTRGRCGEEGVSFRSIHLEMAQTAASQSVIHRVARMLQSSGGLLSALEGAMAPGALHLSLAKRQASFRSGESSGVRWGDSDRREKCRLRTSH